MRKASFVIVAIATLVFSTLASAQSEPSLRHGVERLVAGDSEGALAEFQRVYDRTHSAVALAQMGMAERLLGRWVDAEDHLRAALAAQGDPWIEQQREALAAVYAIVRQRVEADVAIAPSAVRAPEPAADATPAPTPARAVERLVIGGRDRYVRDEHRLRLPLAMGIGAATLLGVGFAGLAMRESVVMTYNSNCRGLGDPSPARGCDESMNANRANAAGALAGVGLITGGLLGIVAAVLAASSQPHSSGLALRCSGGPGDIGISCGGVL